MTVWGSDTLLTFHVSSNYNTNAQLHVKLCITSISVSSICSYKIKPNSLLANVCQTIKNDPQRNKA